MIGPSGGGKGGSGGPCLEAELTGLAEQIKYGCERKMKVQFKKKRIIGGAHLKKRVGFWDTLSLRCILDI